MTPEWQQRQGAYPRMRVLIVDHEAAIRESCVGILRLEGHEVTACARVDEAIELLHGRAFNLVLTEVGGNTGDALALLRTTRAAHPLTAVVLMDRAPTLAACERALRLGAWYYLPKPFNATQLLILVARAAHHACTSAPGSARKPAALPQPVLRSAALVGVSPAFRQAIGLARRVAQTDAPVLLVGERGCGKELLAQYIHQSSRRASGPMVSVNCGVPDGLVESELFGHPRGTSRRSVREKPGLLEAAHGGTLFMDEVLELPLATQAKLLRVIQDGIVRRVGSETTEAVVNVRFIAATNREVEDARRNGRLREDLYYRLNVVRIAVPPLRERPEDIPLLANRFLAACWRRTQPTGAAVPKLSDAAMAALCARPWLGNVRQLQHVIECAAAMLVPGREVAPEDLPQVDEPAPEPPSAIEHMDDLLADTFMGARARFLERFEQQYLKWISWRTRGNLSKAARIAKVPRTTLYRMRGHRILQRRPPADRVRRTAVDRPVPPPPIRIQ